MDAAELFPPRPMLPAHNYYIIPGTWQDHALPAGTRITELSLAGVLGREREVLVPVGPAVCCDDDGCSSSSGVVNGRNDYGATDGGDGGSGSGSGSGNMGGSFEQASSLVLKLRQVNGDGVMSGVCVRTAVLVYKDVCLVL